MRNLRITIFPSFFHAHQIPRKPVTVSPLPLFSSLCVFVCPVFYFAVVLVGEECSRLLDAKCDMHINR